MAERNKILLRNRAKDQLVSFPRHTCQNSHGPCVLPRVGRPYLRLRKVFMCFGNAELGGCLVWATPWTSVVQTAVSSVGRTLEDWACGPGA